MCKSIGGSGVTVFATDTMKKYRRATKNDIEEFSFIALYATHIVKTQLLFKKILSHIRWQEETIKKLKGVK